MKSEGLIFVEASDSLPEKNVIIGLYGQPGAGKTSLSMTVDTPLHLDYDEGLERAGYRKLSVKLRNTFYPNGNIKTTGYGDLKKLIISGELAKMKSERGLKTVIADTGGTMLDDHMTPYLIKNSPKNGRSDGSLSLQGYGALKMEYKWFTRQIRGLGLDCVIVCHAAEKDDKLRPKMTGGSLDIFKETADMLGYLYIEGNNRVLQFNPTESSYGKNVAGFQLLTIPDIKDANYFDFLAEIIRITKEKMSTLSDEQKKALEQVQLLREKIEAAEDVETLDEIEIEMNELDKTLKAQVNKLFETRYLDLYRETCWAVRNDVKGFNEAMKDIPEHIAEFRRKKFGRELLKYAKSEGYDWDKEGMSFVKPEKEEKKADKKAAPASKAKK